MHANYDVSLPTVIAVGFARAAALTRLLDSINCSDLPTATRLLISLDGGAGQDVIQAALDFDFVHGESEVKVHSRNLGLREHIFWVGDQTKKYGSIVVLEDDILVDRYFYRYAVSAICKYESEKNIAGVALYSPRSNEYVNLPFEPLVNNSSSYFMQVACSWGQAWTAEQWAKFREWYAAFRDTKEWGDIEIPEAVKTWPDSSWKKYFAAYLADQDRYLSYPYRSYTTNCSDAGGTHIEHGTSIFEVPLADQSRGLEPIEHEDFSADRIIYDAYMEPNPKRLSAVLGVAAEEIVIDSYGSKSTQILRSRKFCLTTKKCSNPIRTIKLRHRPMEQNLYFAETGREESIEAKGSGLDLYLAESQSATEGRGQYLALAEYYSYQRLDITEFGLPYLLMFVRRVLGRIWRNR